MYHQQRADASDVPLPLRPWFGFAGWVFARPSAPSLHPSASLLRAARLVVGWCVVVSVGRRAQVAYLFVFRVYYCELGPEQVAFGQVRASNRTAA